MMLRFSVLCTLLLLVFSFNSASADSLPNFRVLVENEGAVVVQISVTSESGSATQNLFPEFDPEQIPEFFRKFFEQLPQGPGSVPRNKAVSGSGFIISADGYVITNAHVVKDAVSIRVRLVDRREFSAELIGSDEITDIALLKINESGLSSARIGNSDKLQVGDWVLAIGSPFGFEHTATQGIVSALSRSLPNDTYIPFIQTDVAVNPGNSGGPLFNTEGEVVGVNSLIYTSSGGYQGLSFAIPINMVMTIVRQLKETGVATRGWLGVITQDVDQELAGAFGLDKPFGALVSQVVEGGPADKAGIVDGDIIMKFDGKNIEFSGALPSLVGAIEPGTSVIMLVLRNGEQIEIKLNIEALNNEMLTRTEKSKPIDSESPLGVVVTDMTIDDLKKRGIKNGVLVTHVNPVGPAATAGIIPGDVIISLNWKKVVSDKALDAIISDSPKGTGIPVLVHRNGLPIFLAIKLSEQE